MRTWWHNLRQTFTRPFQRPRSTVTVRYLFPAVLSSALVAGWLATLVTAEDSYIRLATDTATIEAGQVFPVTVYAKAAVPINAVELMVTFPADHVEVFGVDRGLSVLTIWTEDPVITESSVLLRGGTFQRGFLGEHQLATINFRAKDTGQYQLGTTDIRFIAGDGEGTEVAATPVSHNTLTLFNFDETTNEADIAIALIPAGSTDLNNDGTITLSDISAFMGAWNNRTTTYDFNGDGRMTFRDFSIILADFFLN